METAVELVVDISTTQYFTDEVVEEADIETILIAGVNAPSAMNGQPWHFSVISDTATLQQIADDMGGGMPFGGGGTPPEGMELPEGAKLPEGEFPENAEKSGGAAPKGAPVQEGTGTAVSKAGIADAPLAIIISCADGSELEAGLACQNMSVTAQLLGYGTKIISSATMALNGQKQEEYRELLGIPAEYSAVAVLLIGHEDVSIDERVDGYTGATTRNPLDEMVTYVSQ